MNDELNHLLKIERKILYKELQPLWKALTSIDYAVVKGEVLSQQIYGEPDKRISNDIDVLIEKKNVKLLETELKEIDFVQRLPADNSTVRHNRILCLAYSHQISSYNKEKFSVNLNVDVNYDIFWGEYEGIRCSMTEFLSDTIMMDIYGARVKTLSIEKAFVQLILHHYKEMNSLYHLSHYNCIQTHMFKDIYDMLIFNQDILSVKKIESLCEKYSIGEFVYYMIYYTYQVFKDELLFNLLYKLEYCKSDELINSYGLCAKERKVWKIPFAHRLDKNDIWSHIKDDLTEADVRKVILNDAIFT